ncbi:MAG: hypothetical protein WA674_07535 [Candidatus Acidiferrales bacterium]
MIVQVTTFAAAIIAARRVAQSDFEPCPAYEAVIGNAIIAAEKVLRRIDSSWPARERDRDFCFSGRLLLPFVTRQRVFLLELVPNVFLGAKVANHHKNRQHEECYEIARRQWIGTVDYADYHAEGERRAYSQQEKEQPVGVCVLYATAYFVFILDILSNVFLCEIVAKHRTSDPQKDRCRVARKFHGLSIGDFAAYHARGNPVHPQTRELIWRFHCISRPNGFAFGPESVEYHGPMRLAVRKGMCYKTGTGSHSKRIN